MIENAGGMQDGGMAMPGMSGMPNMPGIPGMTTNPFNPIQNSNPMPGNPMSSSEPSGLNVDDLVKKIDAKIAELEKEEEEERKKIEEQKKKEEAAVKETKKKEEIQEVSEEKEVTETVSSSQEVANIAPTMFTGFKPSDEIAPMKKSEPVIDSPVSGIMVTDDQFFDDFFDE